MNEYFYGSGERKTASAKARLYLNSNGTPKITVNKKPFDQYFSSYKFANKFVLAPFKVTKLENKFDITILVRGGGTVSQAEACRHAITRALIKYDRGLKHLLRQSGFVTRDPRKKERKKPGLKRARRAPQWRKR